MEVAGGKATDGKQRILDIQPETLHQRRHSLVHRKQGHDGGTGITSVTCLAPQRRRTLTGVPEENYGLPLQGKAKIYYE